MVLMLHFVYNLWIVGTEKIFDELIVFIFENLSLFSACREVQDTHNAFINGEYLSHCSKFLTGSYCLNFNCVMIGVSQNFKAICMKELDFKGSHNTEASFSFSMLGSRQL